MEALTARFVTLRADQKMCGTLSSVITEFDAVVHVRPIQMQNKQNFRKYSTPLRYPTITNRCHGYAPTGKCPVGTSYIRSTCLEACLGKHPVQNLTLMDAQKQWAYL